MGSVVAVQDGADGAAFVRPVVHGRAGLVAGDEVLDLIVAELPGTSGPVWLGRRWLGCVGAGGLSRALARSRSLGFDEDRRVRVVPRWPLARGLLSAKARPGRSSSYWGAGPQTPHVRASRASLFSVPGSFACDVGSTEEGCHRNLLGTEKP